MYTDLKSTVNPQSNEANTEGREKAPVLHLQTGLRAGTGPVEQAVQQILNGTESLINQLQAKFGTNI